MSGAIFLTRCDGAAIKGNGTSATKAWTVIKKKGAKRKCVSDGEKESEKMMIAG